MIPVTLGQAAAVFRAALNTRQPQLSYWPGFLGNEDGTVQGSDPDKVYVRYPSETSPAVEVVNGGVPFQAGLRIMVGFRPEQPELVQALGTADVRMSVVGNIIPTMRAHAPQHLWGYSDPVYIMLRQLVNLAVYSNGDLTVRLMAGVVRVGVLDVIVEQQTLDLEPYLPAGACYVLISCGADGVAVLTVGATVASTSALTPADVPATPPGHYRSAAIQLFDGQTIIRDGLALTDIFDLRLAQEGNFTTAATISVTEPVTTWPGMLWVEP